MKRETITLVDLKSHATDCAQRHCGECTCGAFEHNERVYNDNGLFCALEDAIGAMRSVAGRLYEFCRCGNNGGGDCVSCQMELDLRTTIGYSKAALKKSQEPA